MARLQAQGPMTIPVRKPRTEGRHADPAAGPGPSSVAGSHTLKGAGGGECMRDESSPMRLRGSHLERASN